MLEEDENDISKRRRKREATFYVRTEGIRPGLLEAGDGGGGCGQGDVYIMPGTGVKIQF